MPKSGCVIFDCGANRGDFSQWAAKRFNATVYAFEADPKIACSLPAGDRVKAYNVAIAGRDGNAILRRALQQCSSTVFNRQAIANDTLPVTTRNLSSLCKEHNITRVNLLKLDIEGAELDVLEEASPELLAMVDQITCEFHDFLDSSHRPRIRAVLSHMRRSGFMVMSMSYWTYGDVIMLNKAAVNCGMSVRIRILAHKYASGIRRLMCRLLRTT
jgi:FkbM family methyltransferase